MKSRRSVPLRLILAISAIAALVALAALLMPGAGAAGPVLAQTRAQTKCVKTSSRALPSRGPATLTSPGPQKPTDARGENGEWTNTAPDCENDAVQTIVNNSQGQQKEVGFLIQNKGECNVLVGTAPQRGDFSGGRQQDIPPGSKEKVYVTVPAGQFLLASCRGTPHNKCDWTISDVTP